jgi:hypothetical protein
MPLSSLSVDQLIRAVNLLTFIDEAKNHLAIYKLPLDHHDLHYIEFYTLVGVDMRKRTYVQLKNLQYHIHCELKTKAQKENITLIKDLYCDTLYILKDGQKLPESHEII